MDGEDKLQLTTLLVISVGLMSNFVGTGTWFEDLKKHLSKASGLLSN
jgi:hypothetical protein